MEEEKEYTTEEMVKVMQAYAAGKEIEYMEVNGLGYCWTEWQKLDTKPSWDWNSYRYRITLQAMHRPFENCEEYLAEAAKHGYYIRIENTTRYNYSFVMPLTVRRDGIELESAGFVPYKDLVKYRWADGCFCGIKED